MKSYGLLFLLTLPLTVCAVTIDNYVSDSQKQLLWGNGICGYVEVVPNFDVNQMLVNAFKSISLNEGKPKEWKILEHKRTKIQCQDSYLIRFIAFKKEYIFVFNLDAGNGKWCVKST
jgi:hypothetical protein